MLRFSLSGAAPFGTTTSTSSFAMLNFTSEPPTASAFLPLRYSSTSPAPQGLLSRHSALTPPGTSSATVLRQGPGGRRLRRWPGNRAANTLPGRVHSAS